MNPWRWCGLALLVVAVIGTGAAAQGGGKPEKLEWKGFQEGKSFYQEMTTTTKQKMKVQGQEVLQTQKQTFYVKWDTIKATDKEYIVEQTITGVKMDIEIGGNKISYDSTVKDQPANPLTDFFKALVGAKFKLTINKSDLTVTKIEGRDEFIKNLAKANPQLEPLLNSILSENALKQMADPTFAAIPPGGAVPKDGKWEKKDVKLDMGPIGTYLTTYKYTVEAADKDKLIPIKVETTLTYSPPAEVGKDGLPFTIGKASNLKTETSTGTILFDPEKGRIKSSDLTLKLKGDLSINIAGQTTEVNLEQDQNTVLTTTDTDPLAKK